MTIVADDYGIGPETSRAILEMAIDERLGATVTLVNSPFAEEAVAKWLQVRPACDLGWHPNLTLDRPICPAEDVASLVQPDGSFWPLGQFLTRVLTGRICRDDVYREFTAQYRRFRELAGFSPPVVNSHQHSSIFPPCDAALLRVFDDHGVRPYVRRVYEPMQTLCSVPGARLKRAFLNLFGSRASRRLAGMGYPGCGTLAGVTDPVHLKDPAFWPRWLTRLRDVGDVEICCHPGHADTTLMGRDCHSAEGIDRRPDETRLLCDPGFRASIEKAGFVIVRPSTMRSLH